MTVSCAEKMSNKMTISCADKMSRYNHLMNNLHAVCIQSRWVCIQSVSQSHTARRLFLNNCIFASHSKIILAVFSIQFNDTIIEV